MMQASDSLAVSVSNKLDSTGGNLTFYLSGTYNKNHAALRQGLLVTNCSN